MSERRVIKKQSKEKRYLSSLFYERYKEVFMIYGLFVVVERHRIPPNDIDHPHRYEVSYHIYTPNGKFRVCLEQKENTFCSGTIKSLSGMKFPCNYLLPLKKREGKYDYESALAELFSKYCLSNIGLM